MLACTLVFGILVLVQLVASYFISRHLFRWWVAWSCGRCVCSFAAHGVHVIWLSYDRLCVLWGCNTERIRVALSKYLLQNLSYEFQMSGKMRWRLGSKRMKTSVNTILSIQKCFERNVKMTNQFIESIKDLESLGRPNESLNKLLAQNNPVRDNVKSDSELRLSLDTIASNEIT